MCGAAQGNCNAFEMPPALLDQYSSMRNTSNVNFTFVGFEDLDGMWVL